MVVSIHLKAAGLEGEHSGRTREEVALMADVLDCLSDNIPGR